MLSYARCGRTPDSSLRRLPRRFSRARCAAALLGALLGSFVALPTCAADGTAATAATAGDSGKRAAATRKPLHGKASAPAYRSVRIVRPAPDSMVFDNNGDLDVDVEVTPPLNGDAGDTVVLAIDGARIAQQRLAHFELGAIDRGSHILQALVITGSGETAIASTPVMFTMWQASSRFPARTRR